MSPDPAMPPPGNTPAPAARVSVLVPLPLPRALDYRTGPEVLAPGDVVEVPVAGRRTLGVVWDSAPDPVVPEAKLKPVLARLAGVHLPEPLRRFIDWVAQYTLSPPGFVARMALPSAAFAAPRAVAAYQWVGGAGEAALTPARAAVRAALEHGPLTPAELRAAGCGAGPVKALVDAGLVVRMKRQAAAPPAPDLGRRGPDLNPEQAAAAAELAALARGGAFAPVLLDGPTGSGKTEVYLEAARAALEQGRQVLVMLPEIALTPQSLARIERHFVHAPLLWHSDLNPAVRAATWGAVAAGGPLIVVGARSALFLPFQNLGLIVVDEEHDTSFKQEDGVVYHARDMAVVRARIAACPVILASATPSLETVVNVEQGRYRSVRLHRRHGGAGLPDMRLVDLRREPPARGRFLAPSLGAALATNLEAGEQSLLFLNRRGYAPLTICRACGHRLSCPNCTAWLVEHRFEGRHACHHCGYSVPQVRTCPDCGTEGQLAPCGPGVERVVEEVAELLPTARTLVMASDTLAGPAAIAEAVERIAAHDVDLVIGTQIVAKGHHFPGLTLVGVVDADIGLAGGDLRAAERTFQLVSQVAGRAGRAEKPGRVLIQTFMPQAPVLRAVAAGDRDGFLHALADERRGGLWPPFGRLAALIVSGEDEGRVVATARALAQAAPRGEGVEVLGPAPAPLALLRKRHRQRLLLKAPRETYVPDLVRAWLDRVKIPSSVRVQPDIDPMSFT
ncbi:primosomal protein N' [Zavarzinia sp. CC-PAN008]|uniref:primosomal protein N' n=1 Tax=Zavarzinia sp. CC-PAN008 TaxID=3243332 RepID=UPI003F749422